jgi:hypothetical protein
LQPWAFCCARVRVGCATAQASLLRAAWASSSLRGALPPVDLRDVCLVRAIRMNCFHDLRWRKIYQKNASSSNCGVQREVLQDMDVRGMPELPRCQDAHPNNNTCLWHRIRQLCAPQPAAPPCNLIQHSSPHQGSSRLDRCIDIHIRRDGDCLTASIGLPTP